MASTYSDLKIQLMATGENSGTWGEVTNTNLGTAIEEAITGSANVAFSSADVTLTLTNTNETQTARNLRLNLTGTSGGTRNLIVPDIEKVYIVNNGLADAVAVKNATGTGIAVPAGETMYVYNDGTNVVDAITHLTSLTLASPLPVTSGGTGSSTASFSGANITDLNASNVSSGTLNNARTTGASTNTANALVLRDASGNFSAGTVTAALSGNSSTATTLETARTINGTSFNGSANITTSFWGTARTINGTSINGSTNYTTANWGTARNLTIGNTAKSVNGSGNVSWGLSEIGALAASNPSYTGTLTGGTGVINIGSGQIYKDSAGRIGIGTDDPSTKVDIRGSSSQILSITNTSATVAGGVDIISGSIANAVSNATAKPLVFNINNSEVARFTTAGKFLVNTTLDSVNQESVFNGGAVIKSPAGATGAFADAQLVVESEVNDNCFIALHVPGGQAPQLRAEVGQGNVIDCVDGGNINFGSFRAAAFTVGSDYRIKENITSLTNALDRVALLQPKRFSFTEGSMMYQKGIVVDGFIAHEVSDAVPEAVTGKKDEVDGKGNPILQSIDQSKIVPLLTAAIQELLEEVNTLKARVTQLEGN